MKKRVVQTICLIPDTLQSSWRVLSYRLSICRAEKGAHKELYIDIKKFII